MADAPPADRPHPGEAEEAEGAGAEEWRSAALRAKARAPATGKAAVAAPWAKDAGIAPAPPPPKKPLRRLSRRAYLGATLGLPLTVVSFFLAVLGTYLQTDRGSVSWLASTWLGSAYLRAVRAVPLLNTLFFNGSALGCVLLASRLGEHKRAPPPPPPVPRSRQERRRWELEARKAMGKGRRQQLQALEERVRAAGGRILKVGRDG